MKVVVYLRHFFPFEVSKLLQVKVVQQLFECCTELGSGSIQKKFKLVLVDFIQKVINYILYWSPSLIPKSQINNLLLGPAPQ